MKKCFVGCFFLVLLIGCKKDSAPAPNTPAFDTDKTAVYIGAYTISEEVRLYNNVIANNEFSGSVIKYFRYAWLDGLFYNSVDQLRDSINVIAFLQTARPSPMPWNYPGGLEDTLSFKVMNKVGSPIQDTLVEARGLLTWATTLGKDRLNLKYLYGAGANLYEVNQLWIKKPN